ncbi:hypothetical protein HDU76_013726 [Blyttiomyces sp. JEL0837]|nr:hypothetical protein HDU76_013726 [Blyttiomyces sp. JEL0837]
MQMPQQSPMQQQQQQMQQQGGYFNMPPPPPPLQSHMHQQHNMNQQQQQQNHQQYSSGGSAALLVSNWPAGKDRADLLDFVRVNHGGFRRIGYEMDGRVILHFDSIESASNALDTIRRTTGIAVDFINLDDLSPSSASPSSSWPQFQQQQHYRNKGIRPCPVLRFSPIVSRNPLSVGELEKLVRGYHGFEGCLVLEDCVEEVVAAGEANNNSGNLTRAVYVIFRDAYFAEKALADLCEVTGLGVGFSVLPERVIAGGGNGGEFTGEFSNDGGYPSGGMVGQPGLQPQQQQMMAQMQQQQQQQQQQQMEGGGGVALLGEGRQRSYSIGSTHSAGGYSTNSGKMQMGGSGSFDLTPGERWGDSIVSPPMSMPMPMPSPGGYLNGGVPNSVMMAGMGGIGPMGAMGMMGMNLNLNMNRGRTIYVTSLGSKDKADIKAFCKTLPGFVRVQFGQTNFRVVLSDPDKALEAMAIIQSTHRTMKATFARKEPEEKKIEELGEPSKVLWTSTLYWSESEFRKYLLGSYDGFEKLVFDAAHSWVHFRDVECARRALEDMNSSTNLYSVFSKKYEKDGSVVQGQTPGQGQGQTPGSVVATATSGGGNVGISSSAPVSPNQGSLSGVVPRLTTSKSSVNLTSVTRGSAGLWDGAGFDVKGFTSGGSGKLGLQQQQQQQQQGQGQGMPVLNAAFAKSGKLGMLGGMPPVPGPGGVMPQPSSSSNSGAGSSLPMDVLNNMIAPAAGPHSRARLPANLRRMASHAGFVSANSTSNSGSGVSSPPYGGSIPVSPPSSMDPNSAFMKRPVDLMESIVGVGIPSGPVMKVESSVGAEHFPTRRSEIKRPKQIRSNVVMVRNASLLDEDGLRGVFVGVRGYLEHLVVDGKSVNGGSGGGGLGGLVIFGEVPEEWERDVEGEEGGTGKSLLEVVVEEEDVSVVAVAASGSVPGMTRSASHSVLSPKSSSSSVGSAASGPWGPLSPSEDPFSGGFFGPMPAPPAMAQSASVDPWSRPPGAGAGAAGSNATGTSSGGSNTWGPSSGAAVAASMNSSNNAAGSGGNSNSWIDSMWSATSGSASAADWSIGGVVKKGSGILGPIGSLSGNMRRERSYDSFRSEPTPRWNDETDDVSSLNMPLRGAASSSSLVAGLEGGSKHDTLNPASSSSSLKSLYQSRNESTVSLVDDITALGPALSRFDPNVSAFVPSWAIHDEFDDFAEKEGTGALEPKQQQPRESGGGVDGEVSGLDESEGIPSDPFAYAPGSVPKRVSVVATTSTGNATSGANSLDSAGSASTVGGGEAAGIDDLWNQVGGSSSAIKEEGKDAANDAAAAVVEIGKRLLETEETVKKILEVAGGVVNVVDDGESDEKTTSADDVVAPELSGLLKRALVLVEKMAGEIRGLRGGANVAAGAVDAAVVAGGDSAEGGDGEPVSR